ncbi:MAG: ABC transporter ATP-binding protein [Candidatus Thorarchaeota archaeon]|nr:ABC transporter ATP-binding protein [Candidatus Thorarchaeota archaeon]
MSTVLELTRLRKTYHLGEIPVNALRGVDMHVNQGEFIAIVGPSGSGKSTLLNMIGALDRPTKGSIKIRGTEVSTLDDNKLAEARRHVGFVFQFFNLVPRLTARANVELPLVIAGVPKEVRERQAEEMLSKVGLDGRMDHKPSQLSGGERQRVAVARALVTEPSFLLLDEPTGNLDTRTAAEIMDLVTRLNHEMGVTVIIVTHNLEVGASARRQVRIVDGLIVEDEVR